MTSDGFKEVNATAQPQPEPQEFQPPEAGEAILVDGNYYFIGEKIGQGAFGTVYSCTDEWSNSLVAKIIVPRDQPLDDVRARWLDELRKLMDLRHPNITYVHNAFEYKDNFYIVMERCFTTFDTIINLPNLLPDFWFPYVARDLLQALDYMHIRGFVHKDIHPGNVFVSQVHDRMMPDRDPVWSFKIGDLGISRLEGEIRVENTLLAQWMLPPEALNPTEFGQMGKSMDIYHTGLLLLALLINRVPQFTREEILAGEPRKMAEGLTSKYAPAVSKALRRHGEARPASAMQLWREIASVST